MYQVETSKIKDLLKTAYEYNRNEIYCFLGHPGISKTQQIYQFAEEHNANVIEIHGPGCLPSEISGINMPNSDSKSMDVFDHVKLSNLKDGDILLFDEILKSPQLVLNAMLTLIQERRMLSGRELPNVLIIAASNIKDMRLNSIDPAFLNRFCWVELKWDSFAWSKYIGHKYNLNECLVHSIFVNHIAKSLADLDSDTNDWNVFTPRRAEVEIKKIFNFVKQVTTNDEEDIKEFINRTLLPYSLEGINIEDIYSLFCSKDKSDYQKIVEEALDFIDSEINKNFDMNQRWKETVLNLSSATDLYRFFDRHKLANTFNEYLSKRNEDQ